MTKVMTGSYSSCICAQCKGTKNTREKKESYSSYVCALSIRGKNMREKTKQSHKMNQLVYSLSTSALTHETSLLLVHQTVTRSLSCSSQKKYFPA